MQTAGAFILIAYGFVIGLVFSPAIASTESSNPFLAEFLPQFVATIAGVIAGAAITLWIERSKSEKAEHERRAAAVNLAVHILSRMHSEQRDFLNKVIGPVRDNPLAWYRMQPSSIRVLPVPQFDYVGLQFLFASKNLDILSILELEESRFATLVELVRRRSELHLIEVQPKVEAGGFRDQIAVADLERVLGPRTTQLMKDYTSAIVHFCDEGLTSTFDAMKALREAALPLVNGRRIVRFVSSNESSHQQASTTAAGGLI